MSAGNAYGLKGIQVWPTMFFTRNWEHHEAQAPPILAYLKEMQLSQRKVIDSDVAVGAKSAEGLYESHFDLFKSENSSLRQLVHFIESSLAVAVCVANNQQAKPPDVVIEFVDSWYHITNAGGFHDAHVHHGCSWCGIYYLQVGSSGKRLGSSAPNGGSRFYCPFNLGGGYRDFGNKYLSATLDPPIDDGLLLLFPSYLMHSGLPYGGEQDRVVIAFNARVFIK
jgi:uncharacterized protein (TIGR02466 family)